MTSIITIQIGSDYNGRVKWSGIVKGSDNYFYCLPYYSEQLLKIDPFNDETSLVGENYISCDKWYNGFAHGGCIYGIPFYANQFLK